MANTEPLKYTLQSNMQISSIKNGLNEIFNECMIRMKHILFADIKYDKIGNIPLLIAELVEIVVKNHSPTISGSEKKTLAKDVLQGYIGHLSNKSETEKQYMRKLMPNMIEMYCQVSLGAYKLKHREKRHQIKMDGIKNTLYVENLYNILNSMITAHNHSFETMIANNTEILLKLMINLNQCYLAIADKRVIMKNVYRKFYDKLEDIYDNLTEEKWDLLEFWIKMIPTLVDNLHLVSDGHSNLNHRTLWRKIFDI